MFLGRGRISINAMDFGAMSIVVVFDNRVVRAPMGQTRRHAAEVGQLKRGHTKDKDRHKPSYLIVISNDKNPTIPRPIGRGMVFERSGSCSR